MLSIPSGIIRFAEVALQRMMIFILFYLSLEFVRMFISASAPTHPYMAMWATIFFELTVIIIVNLQFGSFSVGRDINTISFYGVLLHLFYLLFYFEGINVSEYHNNAAMGFNGLIICDCSAAGRLHWRPLKHA